MILAAITTHKREPAMVERALRSVIAQTYAGWDLVVVDDSPADWEYRDDVRKMIRGYAQKDSRIRYIAHDRNYGAQRARNTALKLADEEGFEFIAYLDDDDEWLPEKLEKQLSRIQECDDDTALVYCFYYYADDDTHEMFMPKGMKCREGYVFDELMLNDFVSPMFPLVRVKSLVSIGGFDEEMRAAQDYDTWVRTAERYKIACVPEPLGRLHRYEGNHIRSDIRNPIKGYERLLTKYKAYYETHKYAYWLWLRALAGMYTRNGENNKALAACLKQFSLQPLRLYGNISSLMNVLVLFRLKAWFKGRCPGLFRMLKRTKQKLKGGITS